MFDLKPSVVDPGYITHPAIPRFRHGELYKQAVVKFNLARSRAWFYKQVCSLRKSSIWLIDLDGYPIQQVQNSYYAGINAVELDQVRGTMGRTDTFDNRFHPLSERVRDRWLSIAMARLSYLNLDPVQLIKIGSCYYVQDGHHRISVARTLGERAIDAEVVTWEVSGDMIRNASPTTHLHPPGHGGGRNAALLSSPASSSQRSLRSPSIVSF